MNGQMDTKTSWLNLCLEKQVLSCLGFLEFINVVLNFWGSVKFHVESVDPVLTSPKWHCSAVTNL